MHEKSPGGAGGQGHPGNPGFRARGRKVFVDADGDVTIAMDW